MPRLHYIEITDEVLTEDREAVKKEYVFLKEFDIHLEPILAA